MKVTEFYYCNPDSDGDIRLEKLSELSNDEVGNVLKEVKGIGQWTVDMFLIFSL